MSESGPLAGRVAFVTGGAGRIGSAICRSLRQRGALVVAADIVADAITELLHGGELGADPIVVDLADRDAVRESINAAIDAHGRLDILVNNGAVLDPGGTILECTDDLLDRTIAVNVVAPFVAIQTVIPQMLRQQQGAIVNVASVQSLVAMAGFSSYALSKAALAQLTRQVAIEYSRQGIRCNAVAPGTIAPASETRPDGVLTPEWRQWAEMHPVGRIGEPHEVAEVVAFLSGDAAGFVTGAVWPVDGGYTAQ